MNSPDLCSGSPLGTAPDEHIHVVVRDGWVDLRVTQALMRVLTPSSAVIPVVAPGVEVKQGDVVAAFQADLDDYVVRSPLTGVAGITCGTTAKEWELVIVPSRWDREAEQLGWGAAGLGLYASVLRDASRHGSPFSELRMGWLRAHSDRRSAAGALDALAARRNQPRFSGAEAAGLAIGSALAAAVQDPGAAVALTRLDLTIAFRMHSPALDLVLNARAPSPHVLSEASLPRADFAVFGSAITFDEWLVGRLDLPAALRRGDVQSRQPSDVPDSLIFSRSGRHLRRCWARRSASRP